MVISWGHTEQEQINMSNVFRRPMFRKGGSAGEGITSGLAPRQGYATNEDNLVKQNDISKMGQINRDLRLLDALAPKPVVPPSTAMNDFLINFGLDLASRSPTGNIFQTAATAAKDPFKQFQQQKQTEMVMDANIASDQRATVLGLMKNLSEDDKNKLFQEASFMFEKGATNPFTNKPFEDVNEAYDVLIRKNLMSKESLKTDEAQFNETLDMLFAQNLKDVNFKGNNLAARTLAEHEAKVIHGKYPQALADQFDSQTTYIDSVYVDENMKLNNIGKNVGYRPNKIYFNIADGAFYKLQEDGETFMIVDINDFRD
tara:strand:- start:4494 stop:5438 length:945 start_codon:yes stop_codon:yes gene_type:complete